MNKPAERLREGKVAVELDTLDLSLGRVRCPSPPLVEAMRTDLHTHGQLTPLVALQTDSGRPQLLDGFKRVRAARELEWLSLDVSVVPEMNHGPWALMLSLNRSTGMTVVEEALLLAEMVRCGMTQVDIAKVVCRHKTWVSRRVGLVTALAPELIEDLKLGLLHPGVARRLLGLPRGNQVELAAAVRTHRLGVRDTEELASLLRFAPDDDTRKWVIKHPKQALEASRRQADEIHVDPRLSGLGQVLQRKLRLTLASMSRLIQVLPPKLDSPDRRLLAPDVRRLREQSEEMVCRLGPESRWPSDDKANESDETG